jgi:hypothetical protein
MGRIDDVLKVAGHRLGTMEIESALVAHPRVAEAAVVGKPHEIKGESVFAFVVLRGPRPTGDSSALQKELRDWVGKELGPIAKPDDLRFADNLPKTRSGKIMRRLLKAIARGEEITQDVSTLENPAILDQLRGVETAPAAAITAAGAARRRAAAKSHSTATRSAVAKPERAKSKAAQPKGAKGKRAAAKKGRAQATGRTAQATRRGARRAVRKAVIRARVVRKAVTRGAAVKRAPGRSAGRRRR